MAIIWARRPGESIKIGRSVVLTVMSISGGQVKLRFEAPAEVPIYRAEVPRKEDGEAKTHGEY